MEASSDQALRGQLLERQGRLRTALSAHGAEDDIVRLLEQVDSALARLDSGDYGRCLICHGKVADEDLRGNPLLEYCLCDLTPNQQRALEHDLELARRIQASLLPDPDLLVDGWGGHDRYEPAGVVSGDYCDLWVRPGDGDDGAVYFAVGDVTGKGVAASLPMAHLQASFRSFVGAGVPLAELVPRVNRQLLDTGITTHFATLACGRLNRGGRIEIVNAGHCPPLVVRAGRIEEVGATGLPVGILEDKPYEVEEFQVEKGEVFVIYTDGLAEARR